MNSDKISQLREIYTKVSQDITKDESSWKEFLGSTSSSYRYSFAEQLLIYQQNPEGTYFASIDEWASINRSVVNSENGVAIVKSAGNKLSISYVYDVNQTKGEFYQFPNYYLTNQEIKNLCVNSQTSNIKEHFDKLFSKEFEKLGSGNFAVSSAKYQVLRKFGIQGDIDLSAVKDFRSIAALNQIGIKSNQITRKIVSQVMEEKTIINKIERNEENSNDNSIQQPTNTNIESGSRQSATRYVRNIDDEAYGNQSRTAVQPVFNARGADEPLTPEGNSDVRDGHKIDQSLVNEDALLDNEPNGKSEALKPTEGDSKRNGIKGVSNKINEIKGSTSKEVGPLSDSVEKNIEQISFFDEKKVLSVEKDSTDRGSNFVSDPAVELYSGGKKTKFNNNIAAIKMMKQLRDENKAATNDEQIILAKYVGWGGVSEAFDASNKAWTQEYEMLKDLLTPDEYQQAFESVLTSYYTDPKIVEAIYKQLKTQGIKKGKILDPAMGTGNFFSVISNHLPEMKLTGVEIDEITGNIAKLLYPTADIQIKGFEETAFKDNSFDVVVGNIPFSDYSISDPRYDKHNYKIHDYFIDKSMDLVKEGGIVALITSKYTLDKKESSAREILEEKADFLGAVRLPIQSFKAIAGTEVTTDILFFQKKGTGIVNESIKWIDRKETQLIDNDTFLINEYFINNPKQILGEFMVKNYHGNKLMVTWDSKNDLTLIQELESRLQAIQFSTDPIRVVKEVKEVNQEIKPQQVLEVKVLDQDYVRESVKNYSYFKMDKDIFYKDTGENYSKIEIGGKNLERISGMIDIKVALNEVIKIQQNDLYEESELIQAQKILTERYDSFVSVNGFINDKMNVRAFYEDSQLSLLQSIEDRITDTTDYRKSDIFTKATIRPKRKIMSVDSARSALHLSLNEKVCIDFEYMESVYNRSKDEIIEELGEEIFFNPEEETWEIRDEYLSGDIFEKIEYIHSLDDSNAYLRNLSALEAVTPEKLLPSDINARIGSTWIPVDYYKEFMYETFKTRGFNTVGKNKIDISYLDYTATYNVDNKSIEKGNVTVEEVFGTKRITAYQLFEDALNLKITTIKDPVEYIDDKGVERVKYVINPEETILARNQQQSIMDTFDNWIWKDVERSNDLMDIYNNKFNRVVPRKYDGSHLVFDELNQSFELRDHQKNVAARIIYDNRALMAHEVGAGKTLAMIASGMYMKKAGIINKPLYVVPSALTDQFAKEFMTFYPGANILVTTKKDFEKKNRERFISKIATNTYDAVIIGNTQFEKIPLSPERMKKQLTDEIVSVTEAINKLNAEDEGGSWSVKQLAATQKRLKKRMVDLLKMEKKDDVLTLENLGTDFLFVDEAHDYKNLYTLTKISNVAGISNTSSQRASDMLSKVRYYQEEHNYRNVVFSTGTPISNSMSELFVMQNYLQPLELKEMGVELFDKWASTFGEIQSTLEITPDGNGYRMRNRFAKFHNVPELMKTFNLVADIQTADMLNLPVPDLETGKIQIRITEKSEWQANKMEEFIERSARIKAGVVDPRDDNMLKITSEAKLMAIDPRLLDESAVVDGNSKIHSVANDVFNIWEKSKEKKSTQIVFSDSGTPKANRFNVYDEIKRILVDRGIPANEVAYIHEAKNESQRDELLGKVKSGKIRILMGSTKKLGTGTNVQNKIIAMHHVDCPWKPSDLIQRDGRGIRQGNENKEVAVFRHVTKGTFDAYLWQIQEQKLKYISQIMSNKSISRSCDDLDDTVLTASEVKAVATDNPMLAEKMQVDNEVSKFRLLKSNWQNNIVNMRNNVDVVYPRQINEVSKKIANIDKDLVVLLDNKVSDFVMDLDGEVFDERTKASSKMNEMIKISELSASEYKTLGKYRGFDVAVNRSTNGVLMHVLGNERYSVDFNVGSQGIGNVLRLENLIGRIETLKIEADQDLINKQEQLSATKVEMEKPFVHETELNELVSRQKELDAKIELDILETEATKQKSEIQNQNKNVEEILDTNKLMYPKDENLILYCESTGEPISEWENYYHVQGVYYSENGLKIGMGTEEYRIMSDDPDYDTYFSDCRYNLPDSMMTNEIPPNIEIEEQDYKVIDWIDVKANVNQFNTRGEAMNFIVESIGSDFDLDDFHNGYYSKEIKLTITDKVKRPSAFIQKNSLSNKEIGNTRKER
ncbi:SNF2-related protein [Carnobacterium maltaromaticum]|uniref:SNF2-related protein n=1 Tax=Carnobacterium maltaromaticum TaxID=2751 RepID=UPI00068E65B5|nr:SNF2-related protein [Carnobacterium maltaromaticum]KRN68639.1 SNF2 family protein [Carnobacterium maltaromaticum DSM 20342]